MPEQWQYRGTYAGRRGVDAVIVGGEIDRLRRTGDLTPSRWITEQEPPTAPAHESLTWDDAACGREFRLIEARQLMRSLIRVRVEPGKATVPVDVIVHVPSEDHKDGREGRYDLASVVVQDVDAYARALGEAERDLQSAERRFTELRRFARELGDTSKSNAVAIAIQGFATVREALAILRG